MDPREGWSRSGLAVRSFYVDSERLECILLDVRKVSAGSGQGVVSPEVEQDVFAGVDCYLGKAVSL